MNGAELLVQRLVDHGVDTVFGLPGEENLAVLGTDLIGRAREALGAT